MANRRNYYRHPLRAGAGVPVRLVLPDGTAWDGTIIDLSVNGMSVQLPGRPPADLADGPWFASFTLVADQPQLLLPAQLIHCGRCAPSIAGFRFVPLIDPRADEEGRKRIAAFLIAEQCRERRQRGAGRQAPDR